MQMQRQTQGNLCLFLYNIVMKKTSKNLLITFLYLFCLYLAFQLVPYEKMSDSLPVQQIIKGVFLLSLLCLIIFEWKKLGYFRKKASNGNEVLLTLPLLLACFSNLLVVALEKIPLEHCSLPLFFSNILPLFLSCAIEELLFRKFFLTYLLDKLQGRRADEFQSVLYSSFAFSLMHVINFTSGAYLSVLLQLGYTFLLGLVLGILSIRVNDDILPICGHIAFNFFNMLLVNSLFPTLSYGLTYYLVNGLLGGAALIYAFVLCLYIGRKEDNA